MKVTWEVEDGYCGKSRPQFTEIDDDELAQFQTEEEREKHIFDCIQDDFDNKISWCIIRRDKE